MLTDLSPLKLLVIGVVAVLVFGPDRLPEFIRNATALLRTVRSFAERAQHDVRSELGPEFSDFAWQDLHPGTFVHKHLWDDSDGPGQGTARSSLDARPEPREVVDAVGEVAEGCPWDGGRRPVPLTKDTGSPTAGGVRFDHDAT